MSSSSKVNNTSPGQLEQSQSTGFTYAPLPEGRDTFRLLRILPSLRFESQLRCELFVASIKNNGNKYIAGSYVWGRPEPSCSILLDGTLFTVRENLWYFLRACRSKYKTRVMWIDAICINQSDVQERSTQVQEMKRIYSDARCVYSWLGYEKNTASRLRLFLRNLPVAVEDLFACNSPGFRSRHFGRQIDRFSKAEYWMRIWILQEFILAKEIYFLAGRKKVSFQKVRNLIRSTIDRGVSVYGTDLRRMVLQQSYRERLESREFEPLFETFGNMLCSIPQDKVFGLLGLVGVRELDLELVKVIDYSLTVWQLLQRILDTKALQDPLRFMSYYHVYVIRGHADNLMNAVSLELDLHLRLPQCGANDYVQDITETIEIREFSIHIASMDICMYNNLYLYQLPTDRPRTSELLYLPAISARDTGYNTFSTYAMVETCDRQCYMRCSGHSIFGFARADLTVESSITMAEVSLHEHSRRAHSRKYMQMLDESLPKMMCALAKTTRAVKVVPARYRVDSNFGTLLAMYKFLRRFGVLFHSDQWTLDNRYH